MRSIPMFLTAALLAAMPALAATSTTAKGVEEPSAMPTLDVPVVQGCFSSPGELEFVGTPDFNSKDKCATDTCKAKNKAVAATMGGNQCYCGDKYPPHAALTNDSMCNIGCTGYDLQACGGSFFWTVYNTGLTLAVKESDDSVLSSSSSSATSKPTTAATVTASEVVTVSATNTASQEKSSASASGRGSTNTAGIAAGVVVGVVVVAAALGGIFFYMRRRRNKDLEEKHRRNAAISTFFPGSKPPGSSGGYSVSDARLDPVMAQRRVSNGSIADNEDYSRKILRVTNA